MSDPTTELRTESSRDGDTVRLTCSGSAETSELEALTRAVEELHRDALASSARTAFADVRALVFTTSSCLKVFVTWLQQVLELDEARRYRVVFVSNPRYSWQRRSLPALAAFASSVVEIRTEPS